MKKLLHEILREISSKNAIVGLSIGDGIIPLRPSDAHCLADEIERYYIPRHRDNEGNPWLIGDTAIDVEGEEFIVQGYGYSLSYPYLVNVDSGTVYDAEWCKRPQPELEPDSLEKLQQFAVDSAAFTEGYEQDKFLEIADRLSALIKRGA